MRGNIQRITRDAFARELGRNQDIDHVVLLGAGASWSSGVPTARDCIWQWKLELYQSSGQSQTAGLDITSAAVRQEIQDWVDKQDGYPTIDSDEEYSFYAEKAFLNNDGRRKYFEDLTDGAAPAIGYKILSLLAEQQTLKMVLTTNFDGLAVQAMIDNGLRPREIAIETAHFVHKPMRRKEVFHVALHGDYKYEELKNTGPELDNQVDDFKVALRIHLYNKHLIVMGYSGRDKSLMEALEDAYISEPKGGGILFWCAYSDDISPEVESLLRKISAVGREVVLVVTGDFDDALKHLGSYCFRDDPKMSRKLNGVARLMGVEEDLVVVEKVEGESPQADAQAEGAEIQNAIERLSPAARDAAAKAALFGGWTEGEADKDAIGGAADES